jgi:outer membrane protein assembly factor BamB
VVTDHRRPLVTTLTTLTTLVATIGLVGCSGASGSGQPTSSSRQDAPAAVTVRLGWRARLDGAVYGHPVVIDDLVVAATEADSVYGLSLTDGRVRWRTGVGTPMPRSQLPCGNIDPLGITGAPAYDAGSRTVFVAAETTDAQHELIAIDPADGTVRFRRSLDVTDRDRYAEQQRGALAVAGGRVYVPFGGLAGDCGNYVGYVTGTPVNGDGPTVHYEVPTAREGGIWAPSGVAVDADGSVFVAVGNGASFDDPYDGSDSVLRLSADLGRRLDFFAPSDWGSQNAADADLGSTGPLLLDGNRVLISGKGGQVFLLDAGRLGGIGGQLDTVTGCRGFGGMAWDAAQRAAFVPCSDGLRRVEIGRNSLTARWRADQQITGTPVIAAGVVWSLDPQGGRLFALDERTGRQVGAADTGEASRFAAPVLAGQRLLIPTLAGITALALS